MIQIFLHILLPFFSISALGYIMGKRNLFDLNMASIISRVVFFLALPALMFRMIVMAPFAEFD